MAVDLAWKTLLHDRTRFAITVAGVAFAVTLVLVQVGLFFGLLDNATITIEKIDAELWVTSRNTPNVDFAHEFPEGLVDRIRSVPGVRRADPLILAYVNMSLPTGAQESVLVYALERFAPWGIPWEIAEGDIEDLRRGRYVFMDDSATQRFGAFRVGEHREISGLRFKIIGRTREALSFTTTPIVFMDYRRAQLLHPELRGRTAYVLVKLEPGADVEAVRRRIAALVPYNDVYTRAEWASRSRDYWVANTGLGLQMALTVFLGCLVGGVVVAQTLYTSTMEHLREFGTVKAIGGSNADIYAIIGRQAVIAAVVGFAVGVLPPLLVRAGVAAAGLKLIVPPALFGVVFAGTIVLCLAAAAVSFRKVAAIDPALVFRT